MKKNGLNKLLALLLALVMVLALAHAAIRRRTTAVPAMTPTWSPTVPWPMAPPWDRAKPPSPWK